MNDHISWDPSIVKKYSSSNHYKLLNQLRNEVIKYPLNNKKNSSYIENNDNNFLNNNKTNVTNTQNISFTNNFTQINEVNNNKSNVSFNNAKDFSIYNHTNNNNNNSTKSESFSTDQSTSTEESSLKTFKDRLNKIDMK